MLVPPRSQSTGESEMENPTDFLLVLSPFRSETGLIGLVEVFQRPDSGNATRRGCLRFVTQMCELASSSPVFRTRRKPWWKLWR